MGRKKGLKTGGEGWGCFARFSSPSYLPILECSDKGKQKQLIRLCFPNPPSMHPEQEKQFTPLSTSGKAEKREAYSSPCTSLQKGNIRRLNQPDVQRRNRKNKGEQQGNWGGGCHVKSLNTVKTKIISPSCNGGIGTENLPNSGINRCSAHLRGGLQSGTVSPREQPYVITLPNASWWRGCLPHCPLPFRLLLLLQFHLVPLVPPFLGNIRRPAFPLSSHQHKTHLSAATLSPVSPISRVAGIHLNQP
jgi:hypothetical protein